MARVNFISNAIPAPVPDSIVEEFVLQRNQIWCGHRPSLNVSVFSFYLTFTGQAFTACVPLNVTLYT
jgi:hypothetical protein